MLVTDLVILSWKNPEVRQFQGKFSMEWKNMQLEIFIKLDNDFSFFPTWLRPLRPFQQILQILEFSDYFLQLHANFEYECKR